jgi:hypothetical protein
MTHSTPFPPLFTLPRLSSGTSSFDLVSSRLFICWMSSKLSWVCDWASSFGRNFSAENCFVSVLSFPVSQVVVFQEIFLWDFLCVSCVCVMLTPSNHPIPSNRTCLYKSHSFSLCNVHTKVLTFSVLLGVHVFSWTLVPWFDIGCSVHGEYVNNTKVQLTCTSLFSLQCISV